jgi:hypothetical protein
MMALYEKAPLVEVDPAPGGSVALVIGRGGAQPLALTPIAAYELAVVLLRTVAAITADDDDEELTQ